MLIRGWFPRVGILSRKRASAIFSRDKDKLNPVDNFKRFSWILVDFNGFIGFMVLWFYVSIKTLLLLVFFTGLVYGIIFLLSEITLLSTLHKRYCLVSAIWSLNKQIIRQEVCQYYCFLVCIFLGKKGAYLHLHLHV